MPKKIHKKKKIVLKHRKNKKKKKLLRPKKLGKKRVVVQKKKLRKVLSKEEKKAKISENSLKELIDRGRPRGFVTDNEILFYFPNIEDNISFLEQVYDRLEKADIKIIETSALIDFSQDEKVSLSFLNRHDERLKEESETSLMLSQAETFCQH